MFSSSMRGEDVLDKINRIKISLEDSGIHRVKMIADLKRSPLEKLVPVFMYKRKRFLIVTDEQCKRLDDKQIAEIRKMNVCYKNRKHAARVEEIIQKMQKVMPGKFSGKYLLLNSRKINALCCPYGTLIITKGLMESTTLDELAFVIGHEYGHFLARHNAESLSKALISQSVEKGLLVLFDGIGKEDGMKKLGKFAVQLGYRSGMILGVQLPNSRKCELEADRIAVYLAKSAGYNMHKGIRLLEKWAEKERSASKFDYLFSTHPDCKSRFILTTDILAGLEKGKDTTTLPLWGTPMDDIKENSKAAAIKSYLAMQNRSVKETGKEKTSPVKKSVRDKKGRLKNFWKKKFPPKPMPKNSGEQTPPQEISMLKINSVNLMRVCE